jgi:hypothetical protein
MGQPGSRLSHDLALIHIRHLIRKSGFPCQSAPPALDRIRAIEQVTQVCWVGGLHRNSSRIAREGDSHFSYGSAQRTTTIAHLPDERTRRDNVSSSGWLQSAAVLIPVMRAGARFDDLNRGDKINKLSCKRISPIARFGSKRCTNNTDAWRKQDNEITHL